MPRNPEEYYDPAADADLDPAAEHDSNGFTAAGQLGFKEEVNNCPVNSYLDVNSKVDWSSLSQLAPEDQTRFAASLQHMLDRILNEAADNQVGYDSILLDPATVHPRDLKALEQAAAFPEGGILDDYQIVGHPRLTEPEVQQAIAVWQIEKTWAPVTDAIAAGPENSSVKTDFSDRQFLYQLVGAQKESRQAASATALAAVADARSKDKPDWEDLVDQVTDQEYTNYVHAEQFLQTLNHMPEPRPFQYYTEQLPTFAEASQLTAGVTQMRNPTLRGQAEAILQDLTLLAEAATDNAQVQPNPAQLLATPQGSSLTDHSLNMHPAKALQFLQEWDQQAEAAQRAEMDRRYAARSE